MYKYTCLMFIYLRTIYKCEHAARIFYFFYLFIRIKSYDLKSNKQKNKYYHNNSIKYQTT